jgi:xanthine dehydrogenase molybdopterin-binding subunit B
VGYDREGRLLAAQVELVRTAAGRSTCRSPMLDRALFHLDNAYYIPAVHFTGRVAKTNVDLAHGVPRLRRAAGHAGHRGDHRPHRAPARPAAGGGARAQPLPRRGETNTTHYREEIGDNRSRRIWKQVLAQAKFRERARRSRRGTGRTRTGEARARGHAGEVRHLFTLTHYNQAGALVLIYQDGTVQVNHGGTEMGQGLHTKILGVAMRELGLPAASIR